MFFQTHVGKVREHPQLRPHMLAIAKSDPKLMRLYLSSATDEEFASLLHELVDAHPALETFTPEEKRELFQVWHDRGDAAELVRRLEEDTAWQKDGWPVLAAHKAKDGDFHGAYEVALKNVPAPRPRAARTQADVADLTRVFHLAPHDIDAGLDLYEAQRREGRFDDALATLDQLAKLPQPPASVLYHRGVTLAAKGDYASAWQALRDYARRLAQEEKI
jgi:tetratricopeptide (TPR) repeat protein